MKTPGQHAAHTLYEQAHSSDWAAPRYQGFAVFGADETVRNWSRPAGVHWTEFRHAGTTRPWRPPPTSGLLPTQPSAAATAEGSRVLR